MGTGELGAGGTLAEAPALGCREGRKAATLESWNRVPQAGGFKYRRKATRFLGHFKVNVEDRFQSEAQARCSVLQGRKVLFKSYPRTS